MKDNKNQLGKNATNKDFSNERDADAASQAGSVYQRFEFADTVVREDAEKAYKHMRRYSIDDNGGGYLGL
jgi:hypothetical protein